MFPKIKRKDRIFGAIGFIFIVIGIVCIFIFTESTLNFILSLAICILGFIVFLLSRFI